MNDSPVFLPAYTLTHGAFDPEYGQTFCASFKEQGKRRCSFGLALRDAHNMVSRYATRKATGESTPVCILSNRPFPLAVEVQPQLWRLTFLPIE